ncbi:hypothetical protein PG985_016453 [Apiospora marii]|uniref:uncharacterized protein n=1 Tax=Apiospora marii TaxID=335849 RepID=UPI00312E9BC2
MKLQTPLLSGKVRLLLLLISFCSANSRPVLAVNLRETAASGFRGSVVELASPWRRPVLQLWVPASCRALRSGW